MELNGDSLCCLFIIIMMVYKRATFVALYLCWLKLCMIQDPFDLSNHKTIALTSGHLGSIWDMVLDNKKFNLPYSLIMRSNSSLALANSVVREWVLVDYLSCLLKTKLSKGYWLNCFQIGRWR